MSITQILSTDGRQEQKKSAPGTNRGADDDSSAGANACVYSNYSADVAQHQLSRQFSLAVDAQWDGIHYFEEQAAQRRRQGESTLTCDLLADRYRRRLRMLERCIPVGEVRT